MGLPIFREPEDAAPANVVDKVDRANSASRRTIRRQQTIRPYRENSNATSSFDANEGLTSSWHRRRHTSRSTRQRSPPLIPRTGIHTAASDTNSNFEQIGTPNLPDALQHDRDILDNVANPTLRDALQRDRDAHRARPHRSGESGLRFEVAPSPPSTGFLQEDGPVEQSSRQRYMPSPPYSSSGNRPSRNGPVSTTPPLTVGFAPAFPVNDVNSNVSYHPPRIPTPPSQNLSEIYPSRRRAYDGTIRHPTASHHEHIGNRRRSPSSSSDSDLEEDTWNTLLSTMEPDEHLPSVHSSFTSASASASTSRSAASNSARSSQSTAPSSIDTLRPTEATAGSTYCPQSPTGSGDDMSDAGDDDRAPAPPQALIQQMNRRAAALSRHTAALSRQSRRWRDRVLIDREIRAQEERDRPHSRHGINLNEDDHVHLPVILDGDFRASPRPVDGPVNPDNTSIASTALDREIAQEQQGIQRWHLRLPREVEEARGAPSSHAGLRNMEAVRREVFGSPETDGDDLATLQRVIERMARREDIPDEWWAAVGLRRSF